MLNELKARGLDLAASLANPWRQMLKLDIIGSALGVSVLLLVYYTTVAFGVVYLVNHLRLHPGTRERPAELELGCQRGWHSSSQAYGPTRCAYASLSWWQAAWARRC